ncbi:MAG: hypothetical protein ACREMA_05050, partial [Longimicrobiales bacterium]
PDRAAQPRAPGKWSPAQIIGHLIDSASNDHQRFVRARFRADLRLTATTRKPGRLCPPASP